MRCLLICLVVVGCHRREVALAVEPVAEPTAAVEPCGGNPDPLADGLVALRVPLDGGCIDAVRADLTRFKLRVLTAVHDGGSHPAPAWRDAFHLAAVINAGMFHTQGGPVGLIVEDGVAVGADNKAMSGYLAFDPRSPGDPPVALAGRTCARFDLGELRRRYRSLVQSYRLLGCTGDALPWQDAKRYSAAAIGIERSGRVVMLHARTAVTMSVFAKALVAPELDLAGALFLEGGPEASLVAHGERDLELVGSFETGFVENDDNRAFWWLPNVLALEARG